MADLRLRDVTLRDGLQDEVPVPTDRKVALFEALVAAGVREVELTSFVRPDLVPAMADATELAAATSTTAVQRWALVLNRRGVQRAVDAGMDHLQFVVSTSDSHSVNNAGRRVDDAIAQLEVTLASLPPHVVTEVVIATAFGCPYEGPIPPTKVLAIADRALGAGVGSISLADTIGTAIPTEVKSLVGRARAVAGPDAVAVHLHDTRGLGVANALAAVEAGACRLDATVGGLGGCPFAPGASGNVALEDLVHVLEESGVDTGIDIDALIGVAHLACDLVHRPLASHVGAAGPRFRSPTAVGAAAAKARARDHP